MTINRQGFVWGSFLCVALPMAAGVAGAQGLARMAPYPASQVIGKVVWAGKETVVRRAHDSDNWPLTWADDDNLYTAYGDGAGFKPFVPAKLSLGFARVTGGAANFAGENIRCPSLEQMGAGRKGGKASGLLCVEGVLYLWVRNTGNSQLAWSEDHGTNWHWADWKFTESFGCPTFLNFGRNYAGARDEFVYAYSPDSATAYEVVDRMVLARVPMAKIRERAAYEFFTGLSDQNWSGDIKQRGAVFSAAGFCYRASVAYDAGLKRYLLTQAVPNAASQDHAGKIDTRFAGGLGIYEASEPWGPWATVFFTNRWDVGPGDSASLPTKWMSANGRKLSLVFSGDDNFCVRQVEFQKSH